MQIKTGLLSVTNKQALPEFARALSEAGVRLIATAGTASFLRAYQVQAETIGDVFGAEEMIGGRVKTLHPKLFASILAVRSKEEHRRELEVQKIPPIDLVCVNLYPFEEVARKPGTPLEDSLENIDIGGVSLLRAAAKNFRDVVTVCDPADYPRVSQAVQKGDFPEALRRELGLKAFRYVSGYDQAIVRYLEGPVEFPETWDLRIQKVCDLRYGENPHQRAALYRFGHITAPGVTNSSQVNGKELSYNNLLDGDAALELVNEFVRPCCAIVKHGTPCGVAIASDTEGAFSRALECDPRSAYGGIVAFNAPVTEATAERIARKENFFEVVIATDYLGSALEQMRTRTKWGANLRVLISNHTDRRGTWHFRSVRDGMLVQSTDEMDWKELRPVVGRPGMEEEADLRFAWLVAKHVKSNAIVIAKDGAVCGIGAGQTSRVDACEVAVRKAGKRSQGAVAASDAFFPFPDGIEVLARAGVKAVIHPGGSIRDREVQEAARKLGVKLVLTGMRHFKH